MSKKQGISDKLAKTKLGSFFLASEDEDQINSNGNERTEAKETSSPKPQSFGGGQTTSFAPTSSFSAPAVSVNVDPETRAKIQILADQADQVSYTKFRELVKNMSAGFQNEADLYRAAFAAGRAFNLPVSEVLKGLDAILRDLSQTEQKFNEAMPQRLATKVGDRQRKISQTQSLISVKREEITRYQNEISRLNSEITKLSQEEQAEAAAISQDEQSLKEDARKFAVALEAVKAPYLAERQKIELYGRGV